MKLLLLPYDFRFLYAGGRCDHGMIIGIILHPNSLYSKYS